MLKVDGTTITLTRGDSARINIGIAYEGGESFIVEYGDIVRFTVRQKYDDPEPAFVIDMPLSYDAETEINTADSVELYIRPEHTRDLPYGAYKFDVQLIRANGDIDTFIDRADLVLTEEVGLYTDVVGGN